MHFKTLFSALLFILFTAVAHSEASAQCGNYYRPRRAYCAPPPPPPGYCAPAYYAPPPPPMYYGRRYYRPRYYAGWGRPHYRHYCNRRCR